VTTNHAVHLIVHTSGDWEKSREATTAELEKKTRAATAFAASPAFRERFGPRIGVVRVKTPTDAPSIVHTLLAEQGIELEVTGGAPEGGETCVFCGRTHLLESQAAMTDDGCACPSCFRAWNVKLQPELVKKPRRLRLPPWLLWPLIALVAGLFFFGAYYELRRLNQMNTIIRLHMPSE
jgi:hypothetical protein